MNKYWFLVLASSIALLITGCKTTMCFSKQHASQSQFDTDAQKVSSRVQRVRYKYAKRKAQKTYDFWTSSYDTPDYKEGEISKSMSRSFGHLASAGTYNAEMNANYNENEKKAFIAAMRILGWEFQEEGSTNNFCVKK